jgi:histidinol-phosphate aminotransferase
MSRFWSPIVEKLTPYVAGEQPKMIDLVKLNTNENPYPPSPKAIAAIKLGCDQHLERYPDPNSDQLSMAIAEYYQVDNNCVFIGNGSDEVLAHTFQALLNHQLPILFPDISYSFYPTYCSLYQIEHTKVPLNANFAINPQDYTIANGGIIFPNPNAPTGRLLALEAVQQILDSNRDSVVVVDEAYIDFGGDSAAGLVADYDNLVVIQTLSKSRSLAGLRVGFAIAQPHLINALERVKNSFNSYPLDKLAEAAATAAVKDRAYFEQTRRKIIDDREQLSQSLVALGFNVIPSHANFVFVSHPEIRAEEIAQKLRQESIIVRYFNQPRVDNMLRITVGTSEQCRLLIDKLEAILK